MSGGDIKLLLPLSDGRQLPHRRLRGLPGGRDVLPARQPQRAAPGRRRSCRCRRSTLHGFEFPAPADPEAMLAFVYGPELAGARPVVQATPTRSPACAAWTAGCAASATDMAELDGVLPRRPGRERPCAARRLRAVGRPPARAGASRSPTSGAVSGRDALWFARKRGRPVRGLRLLAAPPARPLGRKAARRGCRSRCALLILNELRTVLLTGAELAREPHHLYARHLLGCLDDDASRPSCGCWPGWRCAAAARCSWSSAPTSAI